MRRGTPDTVPLKIKFNDRHAVAPELPLSGADIALVEQKRQRHFESEFHLASIDVPLTDLLELEVGDVIPLGVHTQTPVDIYVEDRSCAKGRMGSHLGRLAVRIEKLSPTGDEYDQPAP